MQVTKLAQTVTDPVVSLADLKRHVAIDVSESYYNSMLESMEAAAVEYIESRSRLTLRQSDWLVSFEKFPKDRDGIKLPIWPILDKNSVTINYTPPVGAVQPFTLFQIANNAPPVSLYLNPNETWPETLIGQVDAVEVAFTAGYQAIPEMVKHAVKLLVAHWFRNRETVVVGTISKDLEKTVDALLVQFRRNYWTPFGVYQ
jgi:uncharacterized phiE125 gp8 family phage protein